MVVSAEGEEEVIGSVERGVTTGGGGLEGAGGTVGVSEGVVSTGGVEVEVSVLTGGGGGWDLVVGGSITGGGVVLASGVAVVGMGAV